MAATADGAAAVVGAGPSPANDAEADRRALEAVPPVMDLLRFAAIGSVDDGKSTLIGRLLHDTKQLFDDQIEAVEAASRRRGVEGMDLSFVTDGLRAEREQGITIDVAYRYAATPTRKFVIADCPGHVQYTRNMATGASTADLALVVVDAPKGLREQTRRHVCIAALLGVRHLVVAANKMDLIDWDQSAYQQVSTEMSRLAERLGVESCAVIPVSALQGDNVAERSHAAPWYDGPTILDALEQAPAGEWAGAHGDRPGSGARLPVQWVLRQPGGGRTYAGMVNGGPLRTGDEVVVLPGGQRSTVTAVETLDGPLGEAAVGLSVSVQLADDVDVSRGDLLATADDLPDVVTRLVATVCWFDPRPLTAGAEYRIKHTTRVTPARIVSVDGRLDVNRLELAPADSLAENDIGTVTIDVATPLAADPYHRNRITGSFVVIDPTTKGTVAAGMVGPPALTPPGPGVRSIRRTRLTGTAGASPGPLYPVSLAVSGRRCLVVGGGAVAARKVGGLLDCGALVTVVAPDVIDAIHSLGTALRRRDTPAWLTVETRPYRSPEAADYRLVVTATGRPDVDHAAFADADAAGVWVNSADDVENCTFLLPAVHRDGTVTVAVSTGGASPALAGWLRTRLAETLDFDLSVVAELLDEARSRMKVSGNPTKALDWAQILDSRVVPLVRQGRIDEARTVLRNVVDG